ncbi:MAG: radical SAM protein [Candidatus Hadarchaeales archaeon]
MGSVESQVGREEVIVQSVQRWLNNPLSRFALRFVCGKSRKGGSRLDKAIRAYIGEKTDADIRDRLASIVVKTVIKRGATAFGYPEEELKKYLKDPVIRRGMVNVLEGIAKFGAERPFTSASPFLVVWNYTRACNLWCKHCYENAGGGQASDELTTEEAKRVIDQFEEAGVVAIAFSGGEPLVRKDIWEVAGYAKEKGFFVSMATNGTLITPDVAKKVKEIFDYVEISLDGMEKTHDEFRGIPGVWRKTCEGIKNCVAEGIDTCVAITATKMNYREIPQLVDFAEKELGVKRVIIFNYVPVGRGKEIVEQDLEPEEREELLKFLYLKMINSNDGLICYSTAPQYSVVSLKFACGLYGNVVSAYGGIVATHFTSEGLLQALRGKTESLADFLGGCGAGRLYCGLEPNGDITPCVFMPIKLGNIKTDDLKEIWEKSEVLWKLRNRNALLGCGNCEYRFVCGGCRARAYGYYGDVSGPDPGCVYNLYYWNTLKSETSKQKETAQG